MEQKSIGRQIKILREAKGLTLRELGERTGLALMSVARIEWGEWLAPLRTYERIFSALDCNVDLVITPKEDRASTGDEVG